MSIIWTDKDAALATGGEPSGNWQASRVVIDSRAVQPGDLFVALVGERFDAHSFVVDALGAGAAAVVISERPDGLAEDAPVLMVNNTQHALEALAIHARKRFAGKLVGITGSVGKTSTREMVRLALSAHGKVYATHGNYNNHIGTPLTLANLPKDIDYAVLELGMNHAGEIAALTEFARPDVALITNVEAVHLEFFDSVEDIAHAKAEIFDSMTSGALAILNKDNPHYGLLHDKAMARHLAIADCGWDASASYRALAYETTAKGSKIVASLKGQELEFSLSAIGRHWALTAVMALAVIDMLGLDTSRSAKALSSFSEVAGRGAVLTLREGMVLIDDSYNASPASMRSALQKLTEIPAKGRKIVVLGDMLELGDTGPELHAGLAGDIQKSGADAAYLSGPLMRHLSDALSSSLPVAHVNEAADLLPILQKELESGDTILIKGSHGSQLYRLATKLKEQYGAV